MQTSWLNEEPAWASRAHPRRSGRPRGLSIVRPASCEQIRSQSRRWQPSSRVPPPRSGDVGRVRCFARTAGSLPLYIEAVELLEDPSLLRVLRELGVDPAALLGYGGEACVFAYGSEQIVRIHHA